MTNDYLELHERIANALGWTVEQTHQFSLQALREIVRNKDSKLAYLLSQEIRKGTSITARMKAAATCGTIALP